MMAVLMFTSVCACSDGGDYLQPECSMEAAVSNNDTININWGAKNGTAESGTISFRGHLLFEKLPGDLPEGSKQNYTFKNGLLARTTFQLDGTVTDENGQVFKCSTKLPGLTTGDDPESLVVVEPEVDVEVPPASGIIDATEDGKLEDAAELGDKIKDDPIGVVQSPMQKVEDALEKAKEQPEKPNYSWIGTLVNTPLVKIDISDVNCRLNKTGYIFSLIGTCREIEKIKQLKVGIIAESIGQNDAFMGDLNISFTGRDGVVRTFKLQEAGAGLPWGKEKSFVVDLSDLSDSEKMQYPDSFDKFEVTLSKTNYTPDFMFKISALKLLVQIKFTDQDTPQQLIIYNSPCMNRYLTATAPSQHSLFNDLVVCSMVTTAQQTPYCVDIEGAANYDDYCLSHDSSYYDDQSGTDSILTLRIEQNEGEAISIKHDPAGDSELDAGNVEYFGRTFFDKYNAIKTEGDAAQLDYTFQKVGENWRWKVDSLATWIFNANPRAGNNFDSPVKESYYFSGVHSNHGWIDGVSCEGTTCILRTYFQKDGFDYSILNKLWDKN